MDAEVVINTNSVCLNWEENRILCKMEGRHIEDNYKG